MIKQFHLGDILSVTTGRLVSPRHIGGVYDILNYMTGDNLFTHQLPRASDECKPYLLREMPWLDDPEVTVMAVGELDLMLQTKSGKEQAEDLVVGWLSKLTAKYGEMHEVHPIPPEDHEVVGPITEFKRMGFKDDQIAGINLPDDKSDN